MNGTNSLLTAKRYADMQQMQKHMHVDEDGRVIVDMTVNDDDDFLSRFSEGENPVINSDVADFIESTTRSIPPSDMICLRIHSDCIDDKEKMYTTGLSESTIPKNISPQTRSEKEIC